MCRLHAEVSYVLLCRSFGVRTVNTDEYAQSKLKEHNIVLVVELIRDVKHIAEV